ncbi:putative acetyltransferase [Chitinophaga rupis]|uniref:Putative acetyltransferase n=1 Tax=Chitinophaga rupis TaxID=573321 RepID=A0A1H7PZR5_9BACT|nr:N-acetyltransferase [Chitinophaga rupis]SEL41401.1 putative acetyltransferase [Chitinophaga rupis]
MFWVLYPALRANGQLTVSLVAEEEGVLIGHIAISPVTISSGSEGWFGLGPVSVIPSKQGSGVGCGGTSSTMIKGPRCNSRLKYVSHSGYCP